MADTDYSDLEITLTMTVKEANKLLEGLQELPFKDVATIFNKIHGQAGIQIREAQSKTVAEVIPAGDTETKIDES
jgi:hypothetical protein